MRYSIIGNRKKMSWIFGKLCCNIKVEYDGSLWPLALFLGSGAFLIWTGCAWCHDRGYNEGWKDGLGILQPAVARATKERMDLRDQVRESQSEVARLRSYRLDGA